MFFLFSRISNRSHRTVIRVCDNAGNVIETRAQEDFRKWFSFWESFP